MTEISLELFERVQKLYTGLISDVLMTNWASGTIGTS